MWKMNATKAMLASFAASHSEILLHIRTSYYVESHPGGSYGYVTIIGTVLGRRNEGRYGRRNEGHDFGRNHGKRVPFERRRRVHKVVQRLLRGHQTLGHVTPG